ncbi:Hypothetical protein FKW44_003978 [Caligus rogercresseyi]|uniref:Uncharacterized protein n=1 Tax=Caligus rogercresseyi TaxID=217165 RepID=A0A7T8HKZ7_CALRO|nr:Hypothetical protein FKW44_003978 [Caligus rogercresseyi]
MAPIQAGNFISLMSNRRFIQKINYATGVGKRRRPRSTFSILPNHYPVVKSVEEKIQRAYGEHLEPPDWLISTSPNYANAFQMESIISKFKEFCTPLGSRGTLSL